MLRYLYQHNVQKGFKLNTCSFRYWKGICFPICMSKGHDRSITCHFIVPRNVRVVISENVGVYTGLHCYVPYFSRLLLKKMAIALKIITLYIHEIPQSKANE